MPRKPRMYVPGVPAHVVQRGHNRRACFFRSADYSFYLKSLGEGLRRYEISLHAYVLMTNHVHLLLTPSTSDGVSRLMHDLAGLYVAYVNKSYRRSGTLWEGRHKASLVEAERYLLTCYRYIELNPVAAGIVGSPEAYPWSSYCCHAMGRPDPLITDHPLFEALGQDAAKRGCAYRELIKHRLPGDDIHRIRESLAYNYPVGEDGFRRRIEAALGRSVGTGKRGRPAHREGLPII